MRSDATRFLVEEAYWAASAEVLRDFRAAAERLRPGDAGANDNLQPLSKPDEGLAD